MTLQEAIKSGKPFRLPHKMMWLYVDSDGLIRFLKDDLQCTLASMNILSDDWEVKTEIKTLTTTAAITYNNLIVTDDFESLPKPGTKVRVTLEWEE